MKMIVVARPIVPELSEFLELVLMWHKSGDVPMDRSSTVEFIEDGHFCEFEMSLQHWCKVFGFSVPRRADVVKALHTLYNDK